MRLICPNCSTQYEVDDSAVPAAGREVQCGSCSSTWFQAPARSNVTASSARSSDLPEWVDDIVESDAHEEAPELPGDTPAIESAPNEEIVSEPELEGLIDTGDLAAGIDKGAARAETPQKTPATAAPETEPDPEPGPAPDVPPSGTDPDSLEARAEEAEDLTAAARAKTASQAAVAAAIAANMSGSTNRADRQAASAQDEVAPAPDPTSVTMDAVAGDAVDEMADVSTELETAIRERTAATKEDFPAIAAAELQASKAAELEETGTPEIEASAVADVQAKAAADAAKKAAEQAAAVKVAEQAAARNIDVAGPAPAETARMAEPEVAPAEVAGPSPAETARMAEPEAAPAEVAGPAPAETARVAEPEAAPAEIGSPQVAPIQTARSEVTPPEATPSETTPSEPATAPVDTPQAPVTDGAEATPTPSQTPAPETVQDSATNVAPDVTIDVTPDSAPATSSDQAQPDTVASTPEPDTAASTLEPDTAASTPVLDTTSYANKDAATTDAIAAEIQNALDDLEAGKPVPDDPGAEKLSDYGLTETLDIPEEFAAVLPDETSGPARGPTERFDPASVSVEKPDMSGPTLVSANPATGELSQPISRADQTETLAAKLKARVAEAAKAQASAASVGTAGVVLGASAAGIATAGGRGTTAFPKRDTEELASSLRPKSVDGGGIKPRLRPAATPEPKKSRFGQGFMLAMAIFLVALLLYLFRAPIITAIPALEPALTSYAGMIDGLRLTFQETIGKMTGAGSGATNS